MNASFIVGLLLLWLSLAAADPTIQYAQTGEEFCGPFPSWKNVKTDFGAKGDGSADDVVAITNAIMAMKEASNGNSWNVLYFPAGTYLLSKPVEYSDRVGGLDYTDMRIVGEDPATTIIAAAANFVTTTSGQNSLFRLDGTYGNISRLTFDGRNRAGTGLLRDGVYGTSWRITDLVFKDCTLNGLQYGGASDKGQDLTGVIRCQFINCPTGLRITNQNCLGLYTMFNLFKNCGVGIDGGGGFAMPIGNVFLRSTICDITNGLVGYPVLNNASFGSKTFIGYTNENTMIMANNNQIYLTTDPVAIHGVDVMIDNTMVSRDSSGPAIEIYRRKNTLSVGNTCTVVQPIRPAQVRQNHGDGGIYFEGHPIEHAFDNDVATYFYHGNTIECIWSCPVGAAQTVKAYTITKQDAGPNIIALFGSNDWGTTWTSLDERKAGTWDASKRSFPITNSAAFAMYRLVLDVGTVAEFELLDGRNHDIIDDPGGLMTGSGEDFGRFHQCDDKIVSASNLVIPSTVRLPGTPQNHHRSILEVRPGTGDDASEIQARIDAAAALAPDSNPIIHFATGTYHIARTIVLPANVALQLVGDGGTSTSITWSGGSNGPGFILRGPSRVSISELGFAFFRSAVDVMEIQNADQSGGRVFCDQVDVRGHTNDSPAAADWLIDGIEKSDVTVMNHYIGSATNSVLVRGGLVQASGGSTTGQVSFINGYNWSSTATALSVTHGGRLTFMGYRQENAANGQVTLTSADSGFLTYACNQYDGVSYTKPFFDLDGFQGTLTSVANSNYANNPTASEFRLAGDGSRMHVFALANWIPNVDLSHAAPLPARNDVSNPAAEVGMFLNGWGFQHHSCQNVPNVNGRTEHAPVDGAMIAKALAPLRALRIDPPYRCAAGVTDVRFIRSFITPDQGRKGIIIRAQPIAQKDANSD